MSRSTRLSTAAHVMMYLAWHQGERVRIDDIAVSANVNPSRLRQLCSMLAQGGFIRSFKGSGGGVELAHPPDEITLLDLCICIDDLNFFALTPHAGNDKCAVGAAISPVLSRMYRDFNQQFQNYLKKISVMDLLMEALEENSRAAENDRQLTG